MTSALARSVLGARALPSIGFQASSFASSSRVGLDFFRPLRAASTRTLPPNLTQTTGISAELIARDGTTSLGASSPPGAIARTSASPPVPASSSSPRASAPALRTPRFDLPVPASASGSPSSSSSRSSTPSILTRFRPAPDDITHTLSITSTRNNVLLTFADHVGPLIPTVSGGTSKAFKNSGRASYEAAYQATLKMIERMLGLLRERGRAEWKIRVAFSGVFGQGREAAAAALGGPEGRELRNVIMRVEDRTPVKIGGTRPRKARRL